MRCRFVLMVIVLISCVSVFGNTELDRLVKCRMPDLNDEYKHSAAVFVGEVIKEKKEGKEKHFTFRVEKYWKGIENKLVKVRVSESFRYTAPYKIGERFLVFAKKNGDDDGLHDRRCSRSTGISDYSSTLKDDLAELGEAKEISELEEN